MRFAMRLLVFAVLGLCAAFAPSAYGQLGILTSTIGSGRLNDSEEDWLTGISIELEDVLVTDADSYAMMFFVSGLGASEIEFDGTIVVQVDQNTAVQIRQGRGRRAPIDVHVVRGRVRAFFDAGEHKDYILLSTPQGRLQVTGSVIYAVHGLPHAPDTSVLGSFDSDGLVTLLDDTELGVSGLQKVVIQNGQAELATGMTSDDVKRWEDFPDLNLASAFAYRGQVHGAYADRTWVGDYVASADRLENVDKQVTANIPDQEPEVSTTTATKLLRTPGTRPQQLQAFIRSGGGGRRVGGEDNGISRETLTRQLLPALRRRLKP